MVLIQLFRKSLQKLTHNLIQLSYTEQSYYKEMNIAVKVNHSRYKLVLLYFTTIKSTNHLISCNNIDIRHTILIVTGDTKFMDSTNGSPFIHHLLQLESKLNSNSQQVVKVTSGLQNYTKYTPKVSQQCMNSFRVHPMIHEYSKSDTPFWKKMQSQNEFHLHHCC